jgi:putative resolvase
MNDTQLEEEHKEYKEEKYLRPEEVCKILKVTTRTLFNWDIAGKIKCIKTKGGHRRFLLSDVITKLPGQEQPIEPIKPRRKYICYCRVSSIGQKEDLNRQAEYFKLKFPNHKIIRDIGSGINFKRKGFNSLLDSALKNDIEEVVVTHKDRLCRFGFELVQKIIESNHGKIVVLDQQETSPEKELVNDLISIITVFSSRLYGLRSNKVKRKIKEEATKKERRGEAQDFENKDISGGRTKEGTTLDVLPV